MLDYLGFYFDMVHSGILVSRTGQLRPDVTALVNLGQQDSARGYTVARRSGFYDREPASNIDTDIDLLDILCGIAEDMRDFPNDAAANWCYSIGCILGSLSVSLFLATRQEWQEWETEHRTLQAKMKRETAQVRDTELLDSVPVVEYTI